MYALNRGARGKERQVEAFKSWGLDVGLLQDKERAVFCAADLAAEYLGLGEKTYEEVRFPCFLCC